MREKHAKTWKKIHILVACTLKIHIVNFYNSYFVYSTFLTFTVHTYFFDFTSPRFYLNSSPSRYLGNFQPTLIKTLPLFGNQEYKLLKEGKINCFDKVGLSFSKKLFFICFNESCLKIVPNGYYKYLFC